MARRVLVVEDDRRTHETVRLYLEREGFEVDSCFDGLAAWTLASERPPDLIVLDILLPGLDGLALCRRLRQLGTTPIILLTARSTEDDKLLGFGCGADDYLTKPFSPRELMARIRAVLRRSGEGDESATPSEIHCAGLVIDPSRYQVRAGDQAQALTPTELRLLGALAKAPGRVFSRSELVRRALGEDAETFDRTIDTHVTNLRRKLRALGRGELIATVFGAGYRLAPEEGA